MSGATVSAPIVRTRERSAERRRKDLLASVATHSVAIGFAALFLLPLVFVVLTSLMTQHQSLTSDLIPHPIQWSNYRAIFNEQPMLLYGRNTVVYSVLATVGVVLSSVPVATMMLPTQVTVVPLYLIFVKLHWIDSLKPLIIPAFFGDAFSIFLLRQFFRTIPGELVDAARVDGANELQIMWHVVVKTAKPAIVAVALFQFLYCWNDFFLPLLYTVNNPKIWTLSVGLQNFTSIHRGVLWNLQMAASVLFMLPVILLFLLAQKAFIEGITLTGVKG